MYYVGESSYMLVVLSTGINILGEAFTFAISPFIKFWNISKTYKKLRPRLEDAINLEAKQIVKGIKLDDKIECAAKNPAFTTLKDHKTNLRTNTPWWLLNPCKSELGKISKMILEKANKYFVDLLSLNQWKNSDMVINWFCSIKNKSPLCIHSTGYHGILLLNDKNDNK